MTNTITVKLRIFFVNEGSLKSFYWFQCKGDDLYWGSLYPNRFLLLGDIQAQGSRVTISLDELERLCVYEAKFSYHESGKFHIKTTAVDGGISYQSMMHWPANKATNGPFRVAALFTKPPDFYPDYPRSPNRRGGRTIQIQCLGTTGSVRLYMEAYLCREGNFKFPAPLVAVDLNTKCVFVHSSLNETYILALRMWPLNESHVLNSWNPELEIHFFGVHDT